MNFKDHENYNCEIKLESGETFKVFSNWLHNEKLDLWQGWQCQAGSKRLYIDKNLDVYSGECKNDFLGNALTDFITLEYTICKQTTCTGCTDDLSVEKKKNT